jgi:hypothetical protein
MALIQNRVAMLIEESDEVKRQAERNAALVSLLGKVHVMLKPYKGQDNFNGQLFKLIDLELFKAKGLNQIHEPTANGTSTHTDGARRGETQRVEELGVAVFSNGSRL